LAVLEGAGDVEVQLTLSPPWTPDRISEDARDELGLF
jgi:metal-sulfur cluster biosynthetic enzyme